VQRVRRRKDAWLAQRLAELTAAERATLRAAVPILEKLSQSLPRPLAAAGRHAGSASRSTGRSGQFASEVYRGCSVAPSLLRTR